LRVRSNPLLGIVIRIDDIVVNAPRDDHLPDADRKCSRADNDEQDFTALEDTVVSVEGSENPRELTDSKNQQDC